MTWAVGATLKNGEYTIEKELSTGKGRSRTYLARHQSGRLVVIKTLNDQLMQTLSTDDQEKMRETFDQEGFNLADCKHPNIVKAGRPFREDSKLCLVMRYINGGSLADRPDEERILPESVALQYIQQIGEALMVVHANNLTHRDVQPKNILLESQDGKVKPVLIGFSLSVEQNRQIEVRTQDAAPGYAPPELYSRLGGAIGAHTDTYSLAATLYDLLTGVPPKSATERRDGSRDTLPAPIGYNAQIRQPINDAIMQALSLDPKDRPRSLYDWLVSLGLKVPPESKAYPATQGNWWTRLKFEQKLAVVTAIIMGVSALGVLLNGVGNFKESIESPQQNSPTLHDPANSPETETP